MYHLNEVAFTSILPLAGVSPRLIKYHANHLITIDDIYLCR